MATSNAEFKTYLPSQSRYSARKKPEEWEHQRDKLTRLHQQNIPRKQMLEILKSEDGFCASLPQLNARFHAWGLRRYEKSTPTPNKTAPASAIPQSSCLPTPSPNQRQLEPAISSTISVAMDDERQPLDFDLEGVGGGFSGNLEDAGQQADADSSGIDMLWAHIRLDAGASDASHDIIANDYTRNSFIGGSNYPGYLQDNSRRFSDNDTSSSDDPVILTPGTSTPSRVSSHSKNPSHHLLGQSSSEEGPSSESDRGENLNSTDVLQPEAFQALPQSRPTAPLPYAILQIETPTDLRVTENMLRCVGDFGSLMTSDRQKRSSHPSMSSFLSSRPSAESSFTFRGDIQRQQIRRCINATAEAYENAHYFLKLGEPTKAIRRLYDATPTVAPMLAEPDLFLLTRLVEIATWSSWKKFPGYEPVVFKFLSSEAGKQLGVQHPLAILLGCFAQAAAVSKSYPTLWTVIIDHIDRIADDSDPTSRSEAQQIRIKAYFYLVRVLRNNGMHVQAIQRCQELIQLCIAIDGTRSFSANRARYNLAVNHCEARDFSSAMAAYKETCKYLGTRDSPFDGWIFGVFALSELAQLYEQEGEMEKAAEHYEEALVKFLEYGGDESSGALLMLKDLIEFLERMDQLEQLERVKKQYPACCTALEMGGLDEPRQWVGRRVTTQASGGKKWRSWTWTSPIT
ncbi:hypothetical protein B0T16DRAFT_402953 [Cercophora newfieldiana]|uniref:Clr5 domain-containing protein n=1 Tax=Cercophora newfieldiana TaxID=92897 RepID=A0AA39YSZ2_9PEZI|nr:hypothetical protein B0T16DRAFT_402953 [Cercophora newfieldiana]